MAAWGGGSLLYAEVYDESYHTPMKKVAPKKSLLLRFEESEKYVFCVLSDIISDLCLMLSVPQQQDLP
jgi:hypothetical protein